MAIYNTPDGRQVVGSVESGNDYHGFNGKRDIIIQLTADGATADGLNALEYLKAYAVEQNKQNKPIFPNGTRVFISANGYTKAVEADDIVIDGDNITIGGIKWDGSAWDYSEAGQTGGALPPVTSADAGKVLAVNDSGVWGAQNPSRFVVTFSYDDATETWSTDKTFAECVAAWNAGQTMWAYDGVSEVFYPLSYVIVDANELSEFDFFVYFYDESLAKTLYISSGEVGCIEKYLTVTE